MTRDLTLYTWNGKLVIVDDGMPVEAVAATYKLTSDTALVTGKTYYTKSGTKYNAVASPSVDNIATYYEVDVPAGEEYTSYVLGEGSINFEDLGAKVPYEMSRDPAKNGGQDTLYTRQRKVFAPRASPTKRPARPPSLPRMRSCPMVPTGLWSTLVRPLRASAPTSTTRLSPSPASSPEAKP